MPTVTFLGPFMWRRRADVAGSWERGQPVEVSQEWLNQHRHTLSPKDFKVEGDAGVTVDAGNDGLPDKGWTIKDIRAWLAEHGAETKGYATKTKLLKQVGEVLNPPEIEEPEPEVVEETIVEEAVEEVKGADE